MSTDSVLWVHEPDGQVMRLPLGVGHHLRPLGWHPDENDKPSKPSPSVAAPKAANKRSSSRQQPKTVGTKQTLK